MSKEEFKNLQRGDMIKPWDDSRTFVVTANYGDRITAVTSVDMTNPTEWILVLKANYHERESR